MRRDPRADELGLSLIEALVIVTVTAMLALMLLPLVSSAAGRNFARIERTLDTAGAAQAEREFRALLGAAVQVEAAALQGGAMRLSFPVSPERATACVGPGAAVQISLTINQSEEGGSLICEAPGRRREMLNWRDGNARFSYGGDGSAWSENWAEPASRGAAAITRHAPMVRFQLDRRAGRGVSWAEHAGWTEPTRLDPEAAP